MKTIICDIDGTLLNYLHDKPLNERDKIDHVALPGTVERMRQWEVDGCRIIIITGRRESQRNRTVEELERVGIPYDMLLMGFADSVEFLLTILIVRVRLKLMQYLYPEIKVLMNLIGLKLDLNDLVS